MLTETIEIKLATLPQSPPSIVEQAVIMATLKRLDSYGWRVKSISSPYFSKVTLDTIISEISDIDGYVSIDVQHVDSGKEGWLLYVPGNHLDCIVDYTNNLPNDPIGYAYRLVEESL